MQQHPPTWWLPPGTRPRQPLSCGLSKRGWHPQTCSLQALPKAGRCCIPSWLPVPRCPPAPHRPAPPRPALPCHALPRDSTRPACLPCLPARPPACSGVVLRVLFHPKELMVISAGDDAEVRVWDLVTKSCAAGALACMLGVVKGGQWQGRRCSAGALLAQHLFWNSKAPWKLVLVRLAAAPAPHPLPCLSRRHPPPLPAVLKGHFSAVTALSLSPDGWTLLCGGRDSVVTVWNLSNHSKLATVPVYEALEGG